MAITVTAATWASGLATFTTSAPHGITQYQTVVISGVTPTAYNGTYTAQPGTTGSTIVVPIASNPGTYTSGGSVLAYQDPFQVFPPIVTGRLGVAPDGSIWATAANKMTMVAPAGTVSPQMLRELGVQPATEEEHEEEPQAEARVGDDDEVEEPHKRGRRHR